VLTLLLTLVLATPPALAGDAAAAADAAGELDPGQARAEYVRLQQELEKLASRNAWAGVERTYTALVATSVPPTFQDHLYGAHAARALGDVTSARQRLLAANTIKEDREVLDWLWEIDSNYGVVYLAADAGTAELAVEAMPFEPDAASAVTFAQGRIAETGLFEGYLPQGNYTFGPHAVKVQPRVQATRIDIRTGEAPKKKKKKD
jgi:hypothetical protein